MEEQTHNHSTLYLTVALSLGSALLLLTVVIATMALSKNKLATQQQAPLTSQQSGQNPATNQQLGEATPTLMQNKQALDNALKTLDGTDSTTTVNTGLDQNTQDSSQFSQ